MVVVDHIAKHGLFCCVVNYVICNNNNFLKNFTIFINILFLLISLDSFIQFFSGFNIIGLEKTSNRVSSMLEVKKNPYPFPV